ncbi:hypothetical protein H7F13_14160 [Proteus vulgaris]|uniref:Exo-alpha-sialidase n=1 Tax=Proteus faecis TaxID=2050967 RepID=A0ABZ3ENS2_9GAMM|nr:hypothetical protein [Proteus faecis]MCT8248714.1 hypothetical protein [Proteus faecis]MDM3869055.1 hypothetical protein [Proteus faecis]QNH65099.1 hypothetical protein H7F13_14160 [Proteus vulgaris]
MNPFFRKPFIIITSLFILSLVLFYGVLFHGFATKWQWKNENASALSSFPYSRYDLRKTFNSSNGILIKTESDSGRYDVDIYGRLYRQDNQRKYTLYYSDKEGTRFVLQGQGSFYNAYCSFDKCVLFTEQGRQHIDLAEFTVADLIPWQETHDGHYRFPLTLIGGKLLFSQTTSQLVLVDNKTIMTSLDEGESWEYSVNTEDLVKQYYAEDFGEFTQFHYALSGDSLIIFYNHHYTTNTLEITLNLVNKEVTQTRWLPLRVKEVAQNDKGEIYLIAQQASRDLYSVVQRQADGNLETFYESGYKYLNDLMISNDDLILNKGHNDDKVTLVFSLKTKKYTSYEKINDDMMFNPALSSFIRLFDNYGDEDTLLLLGERLKYSHASIK